jgi:hypothetical protein
MCYVQQAKEKEAAAAAAAAAAGADVTSDRVLRSRPVVMAEGDKLQGGRREGGDMRATGAGEGRSPRGEGGVGGAGGRDGEEEEEEEEEVEEEEKTISFMTQKKVNSGIRLGT